MYFNQKFKNWIRLQIDVKLLFDYIQMLSTGIN